MKKKLILLIFVNLILILLFSGCFNYWSLDIKMIGPDKNSVLRSSIIVISWNVYPDDLQTVYNIYFGESIGALKLKEERYDRTQYEMKNVKENTRYYWQIEAIMQNGLTKKSDIWSFNTGEEPITEANSVFPIHKSDDNPLNIQFQWQDNAHGECNYDVLFGSDKDNLETIAQSLAIKQLNYPSILITNKEYFWQIKTTTDYGEVIHSPVFSFKTTVNPVGVLSNVFPNNNAEIEGHTLVLEWESIHSEQESVFYDFYFGENDKTLSNIGMNLGKKQMMVNGLEKGEQYYWQVIGKYENGGITESDIWSFSIKQDPATIESLSPQNNDIDITVNPILKWMINRKIDDLEFDVYCSQNSNPKYLNTVKGNSQISLENLEYDSVYYWKVVCEVDGKQIESPLWAFKTVAEENHAPSTPYNPSPKNLEEGTKLSLFLSWNCHDIDGDYLSYDIFLGKVINDLNKIDSNIISTEYYVKNLEYDTVYYWQIIAYDAESYKEGPIWQFKTESKPSAIKPSVFSPSPNNGSKDVNISTSLRWDSKYAEEFDVYFGTSPDPEYFTNTNNEFLEVSLENGMQYYWRVVAKGTGGSSSSDIWSFTTVYSMDQADNAMKNVLEALNNSPYCERTSFSAATNSGSIKIDSSYYSMQITDFYNFVRNQMSKHSAVFFPLELRAAGPNIGDRLLLGRFSSISDMDAALNHEDIRDKTIEELLEYVTVLKFFYTEQWYNISIK